MKTRIAAFLLIVLSGLLPGGVQAQATDKPQGPADKIEQRRVEMENKLLEGVQLMDVGKYPDAMKAFGNVRTDLESLSRDIDVKPYLHCLATLVEVTAARISEADAQSATQAAPDTATPSSAADDVSNRNEERKLLQDRIDSLSSPEGNQTGTQQGATSQNRSSSTVSDPVYRWALFPTDSQRHSIHIEPMRLYTERMLREGTLHYAHGRYDDAWRAFEEAERHLDFLRHHMDIGPYWHHIRTFREFMGWPHHEAVEWASRHHWEEVARHSANQVGGTSGSQVSSTSQTNGVNTSSNRTSRTSLPGTSSVSSGQDTSSVSAGQDTSSDRSVLPGVSWVRGVHTKRSVRTVAPTSTASTDATSQQSNPVQATSSVGALPGASSATGGQDTSSVGSTPGISSVRTIHTRHAVHVVVPTSTSTASTDATTQPGNTVPVTSSVSTVPGGSSVGGIHIIKRSVRTVVPTSTSTASTAATSQPGNTVPVTSSVGAVPRGSSVGGIHITRPVRTVAPASTSTVSTAATAQPARIVAPVIPIRTAPPVPQFHRVQPVQPISAPPPGPQPQPAFVPPLPAQTQTP